MSHTPEHFCFLLNPKYTHLWRLWHKLLISWAAAWPKGAVNQKRQTWKPETLPSQPWKTFVTGASQITGPFELLMETTDALMSCLPVDSPGVLTCLAEEVVVMMFIFSFCFMDYFALYRFFFSCVFAFFLLCRKIKWRFFTYVVFPFDPRVCLVHQKKKYVDKEGCKSFNSNIRKKWKKEISFYL